MARRPHEPRDRGSETAGARAIEQGDRRATCDLAQDGGQPRRAHLLEDRRLQPRAGQPIRGQARPDDRRLAPRRRSGECPMREEADDRTVGCMTSTSTTSLGRLGAWAADHRRLIVVVWGVAVLARGALAPFTDRALSGAGWEAPGSESGEARRAIESQFPGHGTYALSVVVAGGGAGVDARPMRSTLARVQSVLRSDPAVRGVLAPEERVTVSQDRRTAIVTGLAGAPPSEMVEAAGRLKDRLARLSGPGITVRLTGSAAMWSDFNRA